MGRERAKKTFYVHARLYSQNNYLKLLQFLTVPIPAPAILSPFAPPPHDGPHPPHHHQLYHVSWSMLCWTRVVCL